MNLTRTILSLALGCLGLVGSGELRAASADAAVPGSPTPLTRELLLNNLARELSSHFNLEGDLQLELLRAWTPPAQVASAWDINVLEYPSVATSSMLLRCRVIADAVPAADVTFVLRASLWRDAWAARQPVAAGAAFDPSGLEVRRIDMFRERDVLPAVVGDASFVFTRSVGAGRLLTWRDIALRPLVKKGALVEVSAVDGTLVVTMKALAMESGVRGDKVTVRNTESRKDFSATVTDENRVQVRF
ncbi:MAG: flagellar basal body P-ring formation chaperone FlgA [Opitutaceae bacterium]